MSTQYRSIRLCSKIVELDNGIKFPTYFAYFVHKNEDGTYTTIETPTTDEKGNTVMLAKSIHVGFSTKMKEYFKDKPMPRIVTFIKNDKSYYNIKDDRDSKGNLRLDKHGNKTRILIINNFVSDSVELSDFDSFED